MSWQVNVITNTVEISDKCAKQLLKIRAKDSYYYTDVEDILMDGKLYFSEDEAEHMDWLDNPEIIKVLKKNKVQGVVEFGDLEGGEPRFWGYEFDGTGGAKELIGRVSFKQGKAL